MAPLDTAGRAKLPNSAFAYVDAQGRRRLPIHDEAHVRNALARFNQVGFEDDQARDRALQRVLRAAKKYRIVPVGFINAQLRSERQAAGSRSDGMPLPSGFVTMLMTDIEGSTALLDHLGDRYRELLDDVRGVLRGQIEAASGSVVEIRADEVFAVFAEPAAAVDAAIGAQRELAQHTWPDGLVVRVRVGVHSGYPTLVEANYLGMAVHTTARICNAAHGGQTVASGDTKLALKGTPLNGIRFQSLGVHRLRGIPDEVHLHQLEAKGLERRFPPVRTARGPL